MSTAIRAVVFDLDGTLVDTVDDIADVLNRVLAARGVPEHDRDAVRHMLGDGAARLVERALPRDQQALHAGALAEFRQRYADCGHPRTRPYPEIPELLAALAARAVPMAVLSNKPDRPTQELVRLLFPDAPFLAVLGERPGVPLKPDPAAALTLVRAAGLPADAMAFVGDTTIDVRTAHGAGMRSVGAAWGFRGRAELEAGGADVVIDRPLELLAVL